MVRDTLGIIPTKWLCRIDYLKIKIPWPEILEF